MLLQYRNQNCALLPVVAVFVFPTLSVGHCWRVSTSLCFCPLVAMPFFLVCLWVFFLFAMVRAIFAGAGIAVVGAFLLLRLSLFRPSWTGSYRPSPLHVLKVYTLDGVQVGDDSAGELRGFCFPAKVAGAACLVLQRPEDRLFDAGGVLF